MAVRGIPDVSRNLQFHEEAPEPDAEPSSDARSGAILAQVLVAGGSALRLESLPTGLCDWGAALALVDVTLDYYRQDLREGARVVELGCGLGLPGMVCAKLGANVVATDLPEALRAFKRNSTRSGYPQDVWRVTGGANSGGVVVFRGQGWGQEQERLAHGAMVEELERSGEYIRYRKLAGSGPSSAWAVVRRFAGPALLARTNERPPHAESGGSLVASPLRWGLEEARALLREQFNGDAGGIKLVLCSDCVCEPVYGDSWKDLAESIGVFCSSLDTTALISAERRKDDGVEKFVACLEEDHFIVERLYVLGAGKGGLAGEVEVYSARKQSRTEMFHSMLSRAAP